MHLESHHNTLTEQGARKRWYPPIQFAVELAGCTPLVTQPGSGKAAAVDRVGHKCGSCRAIPE